ncbi:Putative WD-repeat family protein [Giardia duodenalis]|uniref:Putative WD-repeat family protein n=1 Tax=Giardia intestinalis TaxID=5741 RepID=V6TJF3_GIAIN|nr:Putative WD-repeat family protein [Giardia intestinalis]
MTMAQYTPGVQVETVPMGKIHTAAAGAVLDICTDPYSQMVATASSDGTIRIYSANTGDSGVATDAVFCLTHHRASVCRVVWVPPAYGNFIISAGHDGLLLVWQKLDGGWRIGAEHKFQQPIADISVLNDNVFVASLDGSLHYCKAYFQQNPAIDCIGSTTCKFVPLAIDARPVGDQFQVACGLLSGFLTIFLVAGSGEFTEQEYCQLIQTPSPIRSVAWGSALLNPYGSLAVGYETGELLIYKAITGEKVELSTAVYTKTVERPLCRVRYGPTGAVLAIAYGDGKSELINPFIDSK